MINSNNLAYTIGNYKSYDQIITKEEVVYKLGKNNQGYKGGWVWKTPEEAQEFIKNTNLPFKAKVYGIILPTSWCVDVSSEPGDDGVHHLLNDACIIKLSVINLNY